MWKSGLVLMEKVVVWSKGFFRPSRRIVLQETVRVTNTDFVGFLVFSLSESDDDDDAEDEEELAKRAFFVAGFLEGGWVGLFLPNWSLSEKRSLVDRPIEMASVKVKISVLD